MRIPNRSCTAFSTIRYQIQQYSIKLQPEVNEMGKFQYFAAKLLIFQFKYRKLLT